MPKLREHILGRPLSSTIVGAKLFGLDAQGIERTFDAEDLVGTGTNPGGGGTDPGDTGGTPPPDYQEYPPIVFGPNPPASPLPGQVWFDTANHLIKKWECAGDPPVCSWVEYEWTPEPVRTGITIGGPLPDPATALEGDTHFGDDNLIYIFEGGAWVSYPWGMAGDQQIITVATADSLPADAELGQLGFVTSEDKMYVKASAGWTSNFADADLGAGSITGNMIAANAIVAQHIASAVITGDKIAATTITAGNIASGAITAVKIAAGAITATKIGANAITADKIAAGQITGDHLAVATIAADKIQTNTLILGTANLQAAAVTQVQYTRKTANTMLATASSLYSIVSVAMSCTPGATRLVRAFYTHSDDNNGVGNSVPGSFMTACELYIAGVKTAFADSLVAVGTSETQSIEWIDTANRSGSVTFELRVKHMLFAESGARTTTVKVPMIVVEELKK